MLRRSLLTLAVALCFRAQTARAEGRTVALGGYCMPPDTSIDEVLRILRAELSPLRVRLVGDETAYDAEDVRVELGECTAAPSAARVTVIEQDERTDFAVNLADTEPGTGSRTLALAVAESIRRTDAQIAATAPPSARVSLLTPASPPLVPTPPALVSTPPAPTDARSATRSSDQALALSVGAVVRYITKPALPVVGASIDVDWDRFRAGVLALGTERHVTLGEARLLAIAAEGAADIFEISPVLRARASAELGVAFADGVPGSSVKETTRVAAHGALGVGVAAVLALGSASKLDCFAGLGEATSLVATADRRPAVSLDGLFVSTSVAVRFR